MFLFCVTEPVDLALDPAPGGRRALTCRPIAGGAAAGEPAAGARCLRLCPGVDGRVTEDTIYLAFSRPFMEGLAAYARELGRPVVRLIPRAEQARILALPRLPIRLGYRREPEDGPATLGAQLEGARIGTPARIALVNPFAFALGDSVVLLTALREFHARLTARFGSVELDLLQHTDNLDADDLYLRSGIINAVHHLPAPLRLLAPYDAYVDFSVSYRSHGLPWVDEMLELLAIDPGTVPAERKRNALPVRSAVASELDARIAAMSPGGSPVLLFHPRASTALRSLPDALVPRLLEQLLEARGWTVASAIPLPFRHPRFLDWSGLSTDFERLTHLVARADAVLCVDTSIYHVADAVDTPAVVLFSSVVPEYRIARYPGVRGILVGGEDNPFLGKTFGDEHADLAAAARLWSGLDPGEIVRLLDAVMPPARVRAGALAG